MKRVLIIGLALCLVFSNVQAVSLTYYLPQIDPLEDQYLQKYSAGSESIENRMIWANEEDGQYCYNENGEKIFDDSSLLIIDVSKWQDQIDWETVKDYIDGVIIRVGYGAEGVDEYFQYNIEECNRLGIPYGVYLYSYASDEAYARREAAHLDELLSKVELNLTLPIYYDIEEFKSYSDDEGNVISAPEDVAGYEKVILSFIDEMNQLGYQGMVQVYSYQWYCENRLNSEKIRPYISWYANYSSLTMTYDNSEYIDQMGWQYTSSGRIPGISTRVDISCFPGYILNYDPSVTRIILNGEDILIPVEGQYQIEARVIPIVCDEELTYTSSDQTVATVQNGLIRGVGRGEAIIKVASANGVESFMHVRCYKSVEEIQLSNDEITITDRENYQLDVTVLPEDAENQQVTYLNLNPEIIQVEDGLIRPVSLGDAEIMVSVDCISKIVVVHVVDSFSFMDVNQNKWYYSYIHEAYTKNFMLGLNDTIFGPYENLNRGMLITILYRMAGSPAVENIDEFLDVEEGKYYTKAIAWAKENGVVNGYSDGTFKPSRLITRQEMAVMLYNYAKLSGKIQKVNENALKDYPDSNDVSLWAQEAMNWAVTNEIIVGDQGKLNPKSTANRAQCAKMIVVTDALINQQ